MARLKYTHIAATLGLVFRDQELLLLKRTRPPKIWAPPGGRLLRDEDPIQGLQREVREECGITVCILMPLDTWFGQHEGVQTLGIIFLCRYLDGSTLLSSEHSDALWLTESKLSRKILDSPSEFFGDLNLYSKAFFLARVLKQRDSTKRPDHA
ncbi:MAG: NUDIX domain-containing protein [Pyrinomonadaceae bacterium]